jgi:uncharacterized protein YdeI (BOF family)
MSFDLKDKVFMKKVKVILTSLTLVLAIAGVVVAKANEKKRTTYSVAYFQTSGGSWSSVTLASTYFDDQSITTQAALVDNSGINRNLFATQATSIPVKFVRP